MRTHPPAHRALDIVAGFTIYRVIGRRPSGVYVDHAMQVTTDMRDAQPLWDPVFEAIPAEPGDQIQDRPGGIVLVTREGQPQPIQLTAPVPRTVESAFTHAERALAADRALLEQMLADGRVTVAPIRRIKLPAPSAAKTVFAEDHPLVTPVQAMM